MHPRRPFNFAHLAPHGVGLSGALVFSPPLVAALSRMRPFASMAVVGRDERSLAERGATRTGYTSPDVIRDKMANVDQSAQNLDASVEANITVENPFREKWHRWLIGWDAFNAEWSGTAPTIYLHSDEVNARVDSYANELKGWYADYATQKGLDGKPVKKPDGSPPGGPAFVPTWAWILGGLAVAGAGYAGYRYIQKQGPQGRRPK